MSDVITRITAYDWVLRQIVELQPAACDFAYQTTTIKALPCRWTIFHLVLRLARTTHAASVANQHLAAALAISLGIRAPLAAAPCARTVAPAGPLSRRADSDFLNPPLTLAQAAAVRGASVPVYRDPRAPASHCRMAPGTGRTPPRLGIRAVPEVCCSAGRTLTLTVRGNATVAVFRVAVSRLTRQVFETNSIRPQPELVQAGDASRDGHIWATECPARVVRSRGLAPAGRWGSSRPRHGPTGVSGGLAADTPNVAAGLPAA
jgi:UDP-N-acetylmuramate dehydrogenase